MSRSRRDPRLKRLRGHFQKLHGDETEHCLQRLELLIEHHGYGEPGQETERLRDQREVVLITYGDSIRNPDERPLVTLARFLQQYMKGVVSTVHILPFTPYSSDDGFSVIDYRKVNPEIGTWQDIQTIGKQFDLMFDLVLNHVSRESVWFKDYVGGIAPARHYFLEVDPSVDLSAVVRPRSHPLLTAMQTRDGQRHVWTTFSDDQIDLNFANPDVLFEFLDILLLYVTKGARIIRLDAIAYLWKEIGTSCIHLPQTHEVVKLLRGVLQIVAPEVLLLTETNVPHRENVSYFGNGDEADLIYQFSLPPLLIHAIHRENARCLIEWAQSLGNPPPGCTFLNFTASHDGIGVRPLEGVVPEPERRILLDGIRERGGNVSMKRDQNGAESPYELNITYFDALGDPGDWGSPLHIRRFLCSQTLAMSLKGIPAIYIHSLTATANDLEGVVRTGHLRSINRKSWDEAELNHLMSDPSSPCFQVSSEYVRRLRIRSEHVAFDPYGSQEVLEMGDEVFAILRSSPDDSETVLCLFNLCRRKQEVDLSRCGSALRAGGLLTDLLGDLEHGNVSPTGKIDLAPNESKWLRVPRT